MNFSNLTTSPTIEVTPKLVISNGSSYTFPTNMYYQEFKPSDFLYLRLTLRNYTIPQLIGKAVLKVYCSNIKGSLTAKLYNCAEYDFSDTNYNIDENNEEYIDVVSLTESSSAEVVLSFDITSHIRKLGNGDSVVLGFKITELFNTSGSITIDCRPGTFPKEFCLVTEPFTSGLSGMYKFDQHQIGDATVNVNLCSGKALLSYPVLSTISKNSPIDFSLFQYNDRFFNVDQIAHLRNGVIPNFYYQIDRSNPDLHYFITPDGCVKTYIQLKEEYTEEQLQNEFGIRVIHWNTYLYYCYADHSYYFIDDNEPSNVMLYLYDKYRNKMTFYLSESGSDSNKKYYTKIKEIETTFGDKITYTWNGNRLSSVTNTDGETMEVEYDDEGYINNIIFPQMNCNVIVDDNSNTLEIKVNHDNSSQLQKTIKDIKITFSSGRITSVEDLMSSQRVQLEYTNNRVSKATVTDINLTEKLYYVEYTYEKEYTKTVDSFNNKFYYHFDSYGRVRSIVDKDGNFSTCDYLSIPNDISECRVGQTKVFSKSTNLLFNPSFDNIYSDMNHYDYWIKTPSSANVSIDNKTTLSNKCLKIVGNSSEQITVKQNVVVNKPGIFRLSGYIKHGNLSGLTEPKVKVMLYATYKVLNPNNFSLETKTTYEQSTLDYSKKDWYKFTVDDLDINKDAIDINLEVRLIVDSINITVYFDDLTLDNILVKPIHNLIENGNFIFNVNDRPTGWSFVNFDSNDVVIDSPTGMYSNILGSKVLKIAAGNKRIDTQSCTYALRQMYRTQVIKGEANDSLSFNILAKADITDKVTFVGYITINYETGSVTHELNFDKNSCNWQLVSASIVTTGKYNSVTVGLKYDGGVEAIIGSFQLYKSARSTHYEYDKFNNVVKVIDSNGETTFMTYDQYNNVKEKFSTLGGYQSNTYTKRTLIGTNDEFGNYVDYFYDNKNRITKEKMTFGSEVIESTVTYDDTNNKETFKDSFNASTVNVYDYLRRITSVTLPLGKKTEYSYNDKMQLESIQAIINSMLHKNTLSYNETGNLQSVEAYYGNKYITQYDKFGRIISITCNTNPLETFTYDSLVNGFKKGLLMKKTIGLNGDYYEFQYTDKDQLSSIKLNGVVIATYSYYEDGSLFEIIDNQTNKIYHYEYDENGRLQKCLSTDNSIEYEYDNNGNIIKSMYLMDGDYRSCDYLYNHKEKETIHTYIAKIAAAHGDKMILEGKTLNNVNVLGTSYIQSIDDEVNMNVMNFNNSSSRYTYEVSGVKSFFAWVKPSIYSSGVQNSKVNILSFNTGLQVPIAYLAINNDNSLVYYSSNGESNPTQEVLELNEWNLVGINFIETSSSKKVQIFLNGSLVKEEETNDSFEFKSITLSEQINNIAGNQYLYKRLAYWMAFSGGHIYTESEVKDIYLQGKAVFGSSAKFRYNSVSYYDNNAYDGFDVITLNGSLKSSRGLLPIEEVNEYKSRYNKKDNLFKCYDGIRYFYKAMDNDISSTNKLKYKLPLTTTGSISFLFKFEEKSKEKCILSFKNSEKEVFGLYLTYNNYISIVWKGNNITPDGREVYSGDWAHFIIRFKPGLFQLYFDTSLVFSIPISLDFTEANVCLCNNMEGTKPLNGMMEMFAYSNEYISDERMANLFQKVSLTCVSDKVDLLGRIKEKQVLSYFSQFSTEYTYNKNRVTSQKLPNGDTINYTYNSEGQVVSKTTVENEVSKTETFGYDTNGRLIQHVSGSNTTTYTYNRFGNLTHMSRTTSIGRQLADLDYTYKADVKDALLSIFNNKTGANTQEISYSSGNIYYPSAMRIKGTLSQLTWTGKRLTQIGTNISYTYNHQGIRIKKITPNETTTFKLEGSNIIRMNKTVGENTYVLDFIYDVNNQLVGLNTSEGQYFYIKDITGNILGLLDCDGNFIVKYKYDPWGTVTKTIVTSCIASNHNPFLYKGYYYDDETQLYWVSSRYYSPELCRWISPDSIEYLDPESINGLNLYAYCGNDPVNRFDPTGHAFISVLVGLGIAALIGAGIGAASYTAGQLIDYAITGDFEWSWGGFFGSTIGGAVGGMIAYALPYIGIGSAAVGAFFSGAATTAGTMIGQNITDNAGYSAMDILFSSAITGVFSAVSVGVMSRIRIPGLNAGRGSYSSVSSQMYTKFRNQTISRITMKTFGKMLAAEAYSGIAGAIFEDAYDYSGADDWVLNWF